MNHEEHLAAASNFMRAETALTDMGLDMAAAEMVWGAAVQAIDAAHHRFTPRHPQSRDRLATVARLDAKYDLYPDFIEGFRAVRGALHNHFYTGRLSDSDLADYLAEGRHFVNAMIELARREHAAQDSA